MNPAYPNTLQALLETSSRKFPGHIALEEADGKSIHYSGLNDLAEKFALKLKENNIGRGDRVALLGPKSITSIAGIYAILKSGACYVPLDPKSPLNRNSLICGNCETKALILHKDYAHDFLASNSEYSSVSFSQDYELLVQKGSTTKHVADLCYILNTSGSTGIPKGVLHTHSSALPFILWAKEFFLCKPEDCFISLAPLHFDLSTFDLFVSCAVGGKLILVGEDHLSNPLLLVKLIAERNVSICYSTPSTYNFLSGFGKMDKYIYPSLRLVLFAGEVFHPEGIRKLKHHWSRADYYNLYGPTETNVCSWFKLPASIPADQIKAFPIGVACPYADLKIGSNEELMISGSSLMEGYWGQKKGSHLLQGEGGKTWYFSGDKVTVNEAGLLEYAGRLDRMIKRNGFRIEPGEIETQLLKHPDILQAVIILESGTEASKLTAHLVLRPGSHSDALALKEFCTRSLPSYMLPDRFIVHQQLPLNSNGKLDLEKIKTLV